MKLSISSLNTEVAVMDESAFGMAFVYLLKLLGSNGADET